MKVDRVTSCLVVFMVLDFFCVQAQIALKAKIGNYDTLYCLRKSDQTTKSDLVSINFPAFDIYEVDLRNGYNITTHTNEFEEEINLPKSIWDIDESTLYIRIYTRNISSYQVRLYNKKNNQWVSRIFKLDSDGFQIPFHAYLHEWQADDEFISNKTNSVFISYNREYSGVSSEFIIGDLAFGILEYKMYEVYHPFFKGIMDKPKNQTLTDTKPKINIPFLESSEEFDYLNPPASMYIESHNGESFQELKVSYQIVKKALEVYPFYEERFLEKSEIVETFDEQYKERLLSDREMTCGLLDSLSSFLVDTFHDPHFGIKSSKCRVSKQPNKHKGPIRFYGIAGEVRVGAVLNQKYEHIPIGTKVMAVNGREPMEIVDSLQLVYGPLVKRIDLISDLTKFPQNMTATYQFETINEPIVVDYSEKLSIPANFKFKHCDFKLINERIGYFYIRRWNLEVYLRLVNHWSEIEDTDALILDLRGNGGGEMLSAIRVFSLFITDSTVYDRKMKNGKLSTLILSPNPYRNYPSHKPVIILADDKTACASESFMVEAMLLPNVTMIGKSKSFGTDATRYDLLFPSGLNIYLNSIAAKSHYPGGVILENNGIEPDKRVHIQRIDDLRPYNDLVLTESVRFLHSLISNDN